MQVRVVGHRAGKLYEEMFQLEAVPRKGDQIYWSTNGGSAWWVEDVTWNLTAVTGGQVVLLVI